MNTTQCNKAELLNQAVAFYNSGRKQALFDVCRQLIDCAPDCADAWYFMGVAQWQQGHGKEAETSLTRAVRYNDGNPAYYNALGVVLTEAGKVEKAENVLRRALVLAPQSVDLLCNLGRALMRQSRYQEAAVHLQAALRNDPDHAVSLANLAVIHQLCRRFRLAAACYRRALELDSQPCNWRANLGTVLLSLGHNDEAQDCFKHVLSKSANHPIAIRGLAMTYCALGQYESAARLMDAYLKHTPDDAEATATLAIAYQHVGNWVKYQTITKKLADQTNASLRCGQVPAEQPLFNLRRSDNLRLNLAVASAWSRTIAERTRRSAVVFSHLRKSSQSDRPLTIGYLSADFRSHAVSHQAVSLFENHDRNRFRICGFSVGPQSDDDYQRRIRESCNHFQDISQLDGNAAAQAIADQGVDILIDLMGHTQQNRLDICALRPAPVQISYLGFLGSSGADFIDYLIGDPVVTPHDQSTNYSEKLIRLPDCYQIISPIPCLARPYARGDVQLPESSFVFCCFNQIYKIDADLFHRWMDILKRVPDSVIWLYRSNATSAERMQHEAARCGISPQRLIFADKVPIDHHMARLPLADLALDTPAYNGGATTANALVAGVPLITTLGNHFVSRMSASHLITLGLSELIAPNRQAYIDLAVQLARRPSALSAVRMKLKKGLSNSPLLDDRKFVRTLERAYFMVWQRHLSGRPPAAIDVKPFNG